MQNDPQITQSAGRLSAVRGICAIRGSPGPARIKSDQPVQPRELGAPHAALALASPRAPAPHMPAAPREAAAPMISKDLVDGGLVHACSL